MSQHTADRHAGPVSSLLRFLRDLLVILVVAFTVSFFLKTFLVRSFYIPSGSMEHTLEVKDLILVDKLIYRLSAPNRGDIIVIVGMVFWAVYTVLLRLKPAELPGLALLACCGVVGVALLAPLAAAELLFMGGSVAFTPASVAAMIYVGTFPSFVGYVFWNRAVGEVGSNVAGIFIHLMPAFGSLLAWMFLGERIHAFHLAGIALILAGVWLTARGRRPVPVPATE